MSLTKEQKKSIKDMLYKTLRDKFDKYNPETTSMPFHTRLLGKNRMALFSFIQSLNTKFGTSIFEPLALELGRNNFSKVDKQVKASNNITLEAQNIIQSIMDDLRSATKNPNKILETEMIFNSLHSKNIKSITTTKIDIFLEDDNNIYLIDLKSVKPNKGEFQNFKRTLLEWLAVTLYENRNKNVHTLIGIPYNPYEPKPYERWTLAGMLDLERELKVGNELWNFIAGSDVYEDILLCFEEVGLEMKSEIDDYFNSFVDK